MTTSTIAQLPETSATGTAAPETVAPVRLTGSQLLQRIKELGEVPKSDLVRRCGYYSTKADNSERLNFTAFYEALLEAKGVSLGVADGPKGRPGRILSYRTKIQFNGNLMVGSAYTAQLGLKPGDEYEIKLNRNGQIVLAPLNSTPGGNREVVAIIPASPSDQYPRN